MSKLDPVLPIDPFVSLHSGPWFPRVTNLGCGCHFFNLPSCPHPYLPFYFTEHGEATRVKSPNFHLLPQLADFTTFLSLSLISEDMKNWLCNGCISSPFPPLLPGPAPLPQAHALSYLCQLAPFSPLFSVLLVCWCFLLST